MAYAAVTRGNDQKILIKTARMEIVDGNAEIYSVGHGEILQNIKTLFRVITNGPNVNFLAAADDDVLPIHGQACDWSIKFLHN